MNWQTGEEEPGSRYSGCRFMRDEVVNSPRLVRKWPRARLGLPYLVAKQTRDEADQKVLWLAWKKLLCSGFTNE